MKNLKNEKAITLIALVITIIVLIILAGVSINLVLGNDGIITKAREARENTVVGQEKEQVELAYVSAAVKKLGDSVTDTDLQTELNSSVGNGKTKVTGSKILSVHFYETNHNYTVNNGTVTKATDGENNIVNDNGIKDVLVKSQNVYVLKHTGDLVKLQYDNAGYVKYDDKFETTVAEGVVKVQNVTSNNTFYYLTTTNDLCLYNDREEITTIASGVKEFQNEFINIYYLTTTNDLCYYDRNEGKSETIASGVKEFKILDYELYYLTTTNDLYAYNEKEDTSITIASGIKEFDGYGGYLTTTNDLCAYNEKEDTSITIASGVKEFDGGLYLTIASDLCYYDEEEGTSKTIASGVKEFKILDNELYYLTTTNDLYYYDWKEGTSTTIASGVKEFKAFNNSVIDGGNGSLYYLTTTNDLYYYDGNEKTSTTIANGVTRYGDNWYELNDGDVYIYIEPIK